MKKLAQNLARIVVFAVICQGFSLSASAQTLDDFFGEYSGTGVSSTPDPSFFAFTDRDMDVEIGPDGDGFYVSWTTVFRELTDPVARRRDSRVVFDPATRPGFFNERGSGRPVDDGVLRWAQVDGDTLKVYVLAIPPDGGYGLQSYIRTVSGDRMALEFNSIADGQPMRFVTGSLIRQ